MTKNGYVLITGASSGIGEQLAHCFAHDGIPLVLVARRRGELERFKRELVGKAAVDVRVYVADLTKAGSAQALYAWTRHQKLPIRYLVNNAGFGDSALVIDAQMERLEDMVSLNIQALVTLSKLYGTDMSQSGQGNIVNIASVAGLLPGPGMAVYYATKAFVISFSQALASELKPAGVIVTTICPAATASNFAQAAQAEDNRIFKGNLPSSEVVAKFAYTAMKKGSLVAIWGISNRVMARMISIAPRRAILAAVKNIQH